MCPLRTQGDGVGGKEVGRGYFGLRSYHDHVDP